jgi:hypothetical protein
MDHHHYQPIWPLLEGTFDYTMNLAAELWAMIWPANAPPSTPVMSGVGSNATKKQNAAMCTREVGTVEVGDRTTKT